MGKTEGSSGYRNAAADDEADVVIAGPTSPSSVIAIAIILPVVFAALVAIPVLAAHAGLQMLLVIVGTGAAIFVPLDLFLLVIVRNIKRSKMVANSRGLSVQATTAAGFRAAPFQASWKELRAAETVYVGPSSGEEALRIAAVLASGRAAPRQQPRPHVLFTMKQGEELVCTTAFALRPEVIVRRLARFKKQGHTMMRPTDGEIDAHRERFKEPRLLPAGFFARSPFVKLTREGLHVGRSEGGAKLHPWEEVLSAHALPAAPPFRRMIQVELADGTAVTVSPRPGVPDDEAVELFAPRYFLSGSDHEHSVLDPPVESKRELVWRPDREEKKEKKKKKKKRVETPAALDAAKPDPDPTAEAASEENAPADDAKKSSVDA